MIGRPEISKMWSVCDIFAARGKKGCPSVQREVWVQRECGPSVMFKENGHHRKVFYYLSMWLAKGIGLSIRRSGIRFDSQCWSRVDVSGKPHPKLSKHIHLAHVQLQGWISSCRIRWRPPYLGKRILPQKTTSHPVTTMLATSIMSYFQVIATR